MEFFGILLGGAIFTASIVAWVLLNRHCKFGKKIFIVGITLILVPVMLVSLGFGWYLFVDEPRTLALIHAAENGDVTEVQELLSDGANPNGDFEGETPLQAAKRGNHDDVIRLLKKAGAVD